ncbi:MAG: phosphoribosyl-ATP diphosphatase [Acidimicrobiales bacterium]|nr:phosphoribosyl-ATP diphosphatase [Acidimicrobiales bacterium]
MSTILDDLAAVITARSDADPTSSYTAKLLGDPEFNQRKIMEEAFEVCLELNRPAVDPILAANEAADLVYHLMVGLAGAGIEPTAFLSVLEGRRS